MFARQRVLLGTGVSCFDGSLIFASRIAAYKLQFHLLRRPAPLGVSWLTLLFGFGTGVTPVAPGGSVAQRLLTVAR